MPVSMQFLGAGATPCSVRLERSSTPSMQPASMVTVKTQPWPKVDSIEMSPPRRVARDLRLSGRAWFAEATGGGFVGLCEGRKSLASWSSVMPMPVSQMARRDLQLVVGSAGILRRL